MRQGEGRSSKFFSMVMWLHYWFKMFTEGQRIRDKLLLFLGTIFRVIGVVIRSSDTAFAIRSARRPFVHKAYCILSRPVFDVVMENHDGKFLCRKGTDDARVIAEAYEYPLRGYFEGITQGVFVDVGSNIGKYTIKVARQLKGNGRVISIEPEISNFEMLQANVEFNGLSNVTPLNLACWNKNERLKLCFGPGYKSTGNHSVKYHRSEDFIEVIGLKLDDILKDLQIDRVDFIKIDAEGADGEVLEGAEETLARNPHLKIIFEAADRNNLAKCREVLGKHGFTTVPTVNIKDYYYARKALAGQVVKCDDEKS